MFRGDSSEGINFVGPLFIKNAKNTFIFKVTISSYITKNSYKGPFLDGK